MRCYGYWKNQMGWTVDDFLVFGAPDCRECWPGVHSWECLWSLGRQKALAWGWPSWVLRWIHYSWPWACPHRKLVCLRREIHRWESMKSCSKRELLSVIGQLQHACLWFGQGGHSCGTLLSSPGVWGSCITECACFQFDLRWWGCFLPIWNGSCLKASIGRGVSKDGTHL